MQLSFLNLHNCGCTEGTSLGVTVVFGSQGKAHHTQVPDVVYEAAILGHKVGPTLTQLEVGLRLQAQFTGTGLVSATEKHHCLPAAGGKGPSQEYIEIQFRDRANVGCHDATRSAGGSCDVVLPHLL
jgi:hypothetical protein